jgi:hypothetical protein
MLNKTTEKADELVRRFWKESADLIDKHRDSGDERAAQGVVDCRILIYRIQKELERAEVITSPSS